MSTNSPLRCIYRVSPWRRAVPWFVFGPLLILAGALLFFANPPAERRAGVVLLCILVPVAGGAHALVAYARLELSEEGVRLRQMGMNLFAPWADVAGWRLDRGREGIITHRPLAGRGAANLAAVRGFGIYGAPLYDEEQRAAMAERRWIPIEAFAWHLRHGRLREDVAQFAPAVQPLPSLIEPPPVEGVSASRRRNGIVAACVLGVAAIVGVVLGVGGPERMGPVIDVMAALLAPLLTVSAARSARNAFRTRAPLLGVLFVLLALVGVFWCVVAWSDVWINLLRSH